MYRERNFFTFLGGIVLFIFGVNRMFTDTVNTAQTLKLIAAWVKQSGLDTQIYLGIRYTLFWLDAYSIHLLFLGFIFLILWKR